MLLPGSSVSGSPLVLSFHSLTLTVFHWPRQTRSLWAMNYSPSWAQPPQPHTPVFLHCFPTGSARQSCSLLLPSPQKHLRFPFSTPGVPFSPLSCFTKGLNGRTQNPLSLRQKVNNTCPALVAQALGVLMYLAIMAWACVALYPTPCTYCWQEARSTVTFL